MQTFRSICCWMNTLVLSQNITNNTIKPVSRILVLWDQKATTFLYNRSIPFFLKHHSRVPHPLDNYSSIIKFRWQVNHREEGSEDQSANQKCWRTSKCILENKNRCFLKDMIYSSRMKCNLKLTCWKLYSEKMLAKTNARWNVFLQYTSCVKENSFLDTVTNTLISCEL